MTPSRTFRVGLLAMALAAVTSLAALTDALAQPMALAAASSSAYAARRPALAARRPQGRRGAVPGSLARPRPHDRRPRALPVPARPECELGLHGCPGRDGLPHGKF